MFCDLVGSTALSAQLDLERDLQRQAGAMPDFAWNLCMCFLMGVGAAGLDPDQALALVAEAEGVGAQGVASGDLQREPVPRSILVHR